MFLLGLSIMDTHDIPVIAACLLPLSAVSKSISCFPIGLDSIPIIEIYALVYYY